MIRLIRCCFVGCSEFVGWGLDDSVVADWLLFHVACATPENAVFIDGEFRSSGRLISVRLCPEHAGQYGWRNIDLRSVLGGEPSARGRAIVAETLSRLSHEDPEAFDQEKMNIAQTLEAVRSRGWAISPTLL